MTTSAPAKNGDLSDGDGARDGDDACIRGEDGSGFPRTARFRLPAPALREKCQTPEAPSGQPFSQPENHPLLQCASWHSYGFRPYSKYGYDAHPKRRRSPSDDAGCPLR